MLFFRGERRISIVKTKNDQTKDDQAYSVVNLLRLDMVAVLASLRMPDCRDTRTTQEPRPTMYR